MIYVKTALGAAAIKDRHAAELTHRQRTALILFEGKRSLRAVLDATAGLGVTTADIDALVALRLLMPAPVVVSRPTPDAGAAAAPPAAELIDVSRPADPQEGAQRYRAAYPLATQLTASLGLRGFKLNLAVESAQGFEGLVELLPRLRSALGNDRLQPLLRALDGVH